MQLAFMTNEVKKLLPIRKRSKEKERQYEIVSLNQTLREFGISFSVLIQQSPRYSDKTRALLGISKYLAGDEEMLHTLFMERKLPVKRLSSGCVGFCRRTLEEHQSYIIAMAVVLSGPYPCLQEYVCNGQFFA